VSILFCKMAMYILSIPFSYTGNAHIPWGKLVFCDVDQNLQKKGIHKIYKIYTDIFFENCENRFRKSANSRFIFVCNQMAPASLIMLGSMDSKIYIRKSTKKNHSTSIIRNATHILGFLKRTIYPIYPIVMVKL
jgi:hypothetical protein